MKIKYYSDPGHGWGAIKRKVLIELGIQDKISEYSYQKGATVYLEEDCDLALAIDTITKSGDVVEILHKHTDNRSPIRSYAPYTNS
jgi:hypothetical protein